MNLIITVDKAQASGNISPPILTVFLYFMLNEIINKK